MQPTSSGRGIRFVRTVAGATVLLLLYLPASRLVPITQWNLHTWGRLNERKRDAPDAGQDRINQQLTSYLPATGRVGFVNVTAGDATRARFFLQYSLAPRLVVPSLDEEFVVEYGVPGDATGLGRDTRFALVKEVAYDLRLFRRVSR